MSFNFLTSKRIHKDIKNFVNSDLNNEGIYCIFDDSNIKNVKSLIIGPKNTPYENGFYFFDITFPNDYPFSPPHVKFLTYENGVRFNPNLYTNGKVCLSILGTWSGPGWTTCLNLNTILLSIQSLLNENPLQNEPGFENEIGLRSQNYSNCIKYYNIKTATIKMLETQPYGYDVFKEIMIKHFLNNIDFYKKYINENKHKNNLYFNSSVYSMKSKYEMEFIESKINFLFNKYNNPEVKQIKNSINPETKRHCPNEPAKLYDIGFKKISENNNKMYKVIEVKGPKRTMKRWVLDK